MDPVELAHERLRQSSMVGHNCQGTFEYHNAPAKDDAGTSVGDVRVELDDLTLKSARMNPSNKKFTQLATYIRMFSGE